METPVHRFPHRFLALLTLLTACAREPAPPVAATPDLAAPAWAADAIWYQVFVERFRNGDPANDPTLEDIRSFSPIRRRAAGR